MKNVSSILTLGIKIFFPTLWLVFFGAMTAAIWLSEDANSGLAGIPAFKIGLATFFFCGATLLYFTAMTIKRVEMDEHFVFVSNYFKHARYPYHNILSFKQQDWLLFRTVTVQFKTAGIFGKKITFVPSGRRLSRFLAEHVEAATLFEKSEAATKL